MYALNSPTVQGGVLRRHIYGLVDPPYAVVLTCLIGVCQLLDLQLVGHEGVGHHAIHQQHERGGSAMHQGAQTPHHHHHRVMPGGEPELQAQEPFRNRFHVVHFTVTK